MGAIHLIGLAGFAGVGKDTVAAVLARDHGYRRYALADPLREGLAVMLGLDREVFEDRTRKEAPIDWLGRSPRYLMQTLGTEWGRDLVAADLWLRVAERRIAALGPRVVVSDIRFDNEADWVRALGGVVWHIRRPGFGGGAHRSESGVRVRPGDAVIANDGTLDALAARVAEALRAAGPRPVAAGVA